ncbi:MAG: hypothetical protein WCW31_00295 [Patescibacteria group bacterium]|jgi:hypothetical protein
MKSWVKVALPLWSLLFTAISIWFLCLVGWNPNGVSTFSALLGSFFLLVGTIVMVVQSQSEREDTERQLQTVRLKAATAVEEAGKRSDSDFQALHDTSVKEIADLKAQLERVEKLLTEAREDSDSLREGNERLNRRIAKITSCSEASLGIIGRNTTILRTMDPHKMSEVELKDLRTNELEAALLMFKGLERFTWFETETTPASCRDFVFALLEKNQLDLTERWARDLVRYAHGAGSDVRER